MPAERHPHSEIVFLTLLIPIRRRRRAFTRGCPVSLIQTTIVIVFPAFPEDGQSLRSLYSNGVPCIARQRVAEDQITMVKSQKVQQFLARILRFAGTIKSARLSMESELYTASFSSINQYGISASPGSFRLLLPHKIPTRENKWWQICKLEWFLQMIMESSLGIVKVLHVCVSSWFLTRPEICVAE